VARGCIACAILGAWLTLILTGCGRPERSWIDRFGRVVGFSWIALSLAHHGASLLFG
jgi:hypothetical protein